LKTTNPIAYHIGFWLLAYISWVFILGNNTLVWSHAITIEFCLLLFIAGNYYFNALYTIPYLLNKKKYFLFGLCFLAGALVGAVLRVPVSLLVNRYLFKVNTEHFNYLNAFLDSFINILFWTVLTVAGKLVWDRVQSQRYIEQIENEKAINELNFLRAQFNPHFLFNSLNSIYAHIDKGNKKAREMLLVFSEMLRYQLYECNVEQIELLKEVNYIKNYIALQKSRMEDRIGVSFCTGKISGNAAIAPLILITFIENAFKYVGFVENKENKIDITLKQDKRGIVFMIRNTVDSQVPKSERSSGLGIANAKRRLELLYPDRHILEMNERDNVYNVSLTLLTL